MVLLPYLYYHLFATRYSANKDFIPVIILLVDLEHLQSLDNRECHKVTKGFFYAYSLLESLYVTLEWYSATRRWRLYIRKDSMDLKFDKLR